MDFTKFGPRNVELKGGEEFGSVCEGHVHGGFVFKFLKHNQKIVNVFEIGEVEPELGVAQRRF